ncbi:MAG TPA: glycosyltransferase family 4 protein [Candidatus Dormibacteraeota bacterium]|nr:glycosyltransferase family 4 protein [Candidatus Dormibacteraeota bacterium]
MRILHILPRFFGRIDAVDNLERMGGAERYAVNLCRAQRKLGHESALMVFAEREGRVEVAGVPTLLAKATRCVPSINTDFDPLPKGLRRFAIELAGYEIVHTHSVASDLSILLSWLRRVMKTRYRLIVTDHGWSGFTMSRVFRISKPMMRFSGFDGLLPVTSSSFSAYANFARVFGPLYGGVDTDLFKRVNGERRRDVLFVGRIMRHKNIENIIRALSSIEGTTRLIIIGPTIDREYRSSLEKLAEELKVDAIFLGLVSDESLIRYYSSSTVLVLPSSEELFGIVLVEAMACELPVVAHNARGIPDAVDNGNTGYLIRPGDINDLKNRLQSLLNDQHEVIRLGTAGRQMVLAKFTWERVAERALAAYREVLR